MCSAEFRRDQSGPTCASGLPVHLEEGDGELLRALGEGGLEHAAAQGVVPHQAPPAVLAQVELLENLCGGRVRCRVRREAGGPTLAVSTRPAAPGEACAMKASCSLRTTWHSQPDTALQL